MPRTCPICRSEAVLEAPSHPEVVLLRCGNCSHCFTDPGSVSEEAYDESYFVEAHRNWFDHPNTKLFELVRREAAALGPNVSLLDVGCGKGDLLR